MLDVQKDVVLAPFTTFHIGGPADLFVVVHSSDELVEAITYAKENNLPFFVLGTGANILVGDKGFRGLVIKNEAKKVFSIKYLVSGIDNSQKGANIPNTGNGEVLLTVESGITISDLINFTIEKGLSGLEHFAGIPSTLGGALWQNLHFLSADRTSTVFIGDIVESAVILVSEARYSLAPGEAHPGSLRDSGQARMTKKTVGRDYFAFGYDYSTLHDSKDIVLSATLLLTPEDPAVLKKRAEANVQWRQEKHPENAVACSAGSVFKKIEGHGAGRLIEQVGLKGKQIGGAKISEKHANFIINTGNATAADVRELISLVQKTVKEQLSLDLQTEISLIGEF